MIRKSKFLGAALVAVLAMSAVAVTAASGDVFTRETAELSTLSAGQEGTSVMKFHGGELKCTNVTYAGSVGPSSITVTPTYSGCTTVGLSAAVDMNGCTYRFNITGGTSTGASLDIVCTGTNEITITAPAVGTKKCIKHIPAQTDLTTITGTNIGSGTTKEVTLDINISNMKYSQTAGTSETGNCATADNTTGGTYTETSTFKGSNNGFHYGLFLS